MTWTPSYLASITAYLKGLTDNFFITKIPGMYNYNIITKFYYQWYSTAPTIVTVLLRFVIGYLHLAIIMPLVPFFTLGDKGACMTIIQRSVPVVYLDVICQGN